MSKAKMLESVFAIIAQSGEAKAFFLEAINHAEENNFQKAAEAIKEGKAFLASLHAKHFELISQEAKGKTLEVSLLLIHAEDQFMAAETILAITEKFILLYKKLNDKK